MLEIRFSNRRTRNDAPPNANVYIIVMMIDVCKFNVFANKFVHENYIGGKR